MLHQWVERQSQYNELIVDMVHHDAALPHSIEAILYDEWVHKQFLDHYRGRVTEADVPLVSFDPRNENRPFRVIQNRLLRGGRG